MVRFLHLADLHMGWEPSYLGDDLRTLRRRERDGVLQKAVDYALGAEKPIHAVIIAGDLFESHDPAVAVRDAVLLQLGRLARSGISVVTVPGNHDEISYHNSVYRRVGDTWPGHLVTDPMPALSCSFEASGSDVYIYSMAYTAGVSDVRSLAFPRSADPGLHIATFHGSLDWDAGERSLPLKSDALASAGYDYIALGHIHKDQVSHVGDALAVYPGTIEAKGPNELPTGHLTVVDMTDGSARREEIKVPVRRCTVEILDISGADRDQVYERCRDLADADAIVQLRLQGTAGTPIDLEELETRLAPHFFHVSIRNETDFISPEALQRYADDVTVRGEFVRRMRGRLETAGDEDREVLNLALARGLAAFERRQDR